MKFISRKGRTISEKKWRALRQDDSYRVVAEDTIGDIYVSTLWWGVDSGLGLFDTWICGGQLNDSHYPYETEAQAKAGHKKAVGLVSEHAVPVQTVVKFSTDRRPQMGAGTAI